MGPVCALSVLSGAGEELTFSQLLTPSARGAARGGAAEVNVDGGDGGCWERCQLWLGNRHRPCARRC